MAQYNIKNLSFSYPNGKKALENVNLEINSGDFVLICGKSGCGKSTLLRLMKHLIAPNGEKSGQIFYKGIDVEQTYEKDLSKEIGFVFQNVDSQIVCDKVHSELAFSLESLGAPSSVIASRIAETATYFGIEKYIDRDVDTLSGGQKQILNLASAMVSEPQVLILDEPLSQLDPIAKSDFLNQLTKLNKELGITVVLSEHNPNDVYQIADKVCVMENGRVVSFDDREKSGEFLSKNNMLGLLPESAVAIKMLFGQNCPLPFDTKGARKILENNFNKAVFPKVSMVKTSEKSKKSLKCENLCFAYSRENGFVLKDVSFSLKKGETVAVVGGNGAGKTTLLGLLTGSLKNQSGKIKTYKNTVSCLFQNPYYCFVKDTVGDDIDFLVKTNRLGDNAVEKTIESYSFFKNIKSLFDANPMDLSGGEAQSVALLKVLLMETEIILLDEVTKGLDFRAKAELSLVLEELKSHGKTIVLVSHDLSFVAENSDRLLFLFGGQIVTESNAADFFSANRFYTTDVSKITKGFADHIVSLSALSGGK